MTTRMDFRAAYELAEKAAAQLAPTLAQLKAVGSLRRKLTEVGDIEFLARPHFERDLAGELADPILDPVRRVMRELGTWKMGRDRQMVVTDVLGSGLKLELFIVHPPASWGSLLAIRTGPADLSRICVTRMRERGYRHKLGHVQRLRSGRVVPTETEEAFFELAGVSCLKPMHRDQQARDLANEPGRRRR